MSTMIQERFSLDHVRGFVDVLGSKEHWPAADDSEAASYLTGRRRLPLPKGPVTIESVSLLADQSGQVVLPGDEFVLVLSGSIRLQQQGQEFLLGTGNSVVVLRDHTLDWATNEPAELLVMGCTAGGSGDSPVQIDTGADLSPSNPPLADFLIGPTPNCRNHSDFRSATGEFTCGTWDSTPYHRRLMGFRHFELMRILEGQVTFTDQHGHKGTFAEGDVVLFVQGGAASWESRSHVKKIYSTYRPAQ